MNKKIIYADHSATTKVRKEVVEAMLNVLNDDFGFGNPSSIHQFGRKAKIYLTEARENIASVINANQENIFFTSGGTESDNTVILGIAKLIEDSQINGKAKHIISTKIEHPAVKEPLEHLESKGWKITWLNLDKEGFIDLEQLESEINPKTALISVIHANNEIGTIQDLRKISDISKKNNVLFHTDAVQSFGKIPIGVKELNTDFISMSSHKIYGPKGTGALYIKDTTTLAPLLIGGGQENKFRPGTENLPGIVGFGIAAKIIKDEIPENAKKLRELQINLMNSLVHSKQKENILLTGVGLEKVKKNLPLENEKYLYRLPGHVSICIRDIEGENLVLQADLLGIAVSSGSACSSGSLEPSHVLMAINIPTNFIRGSLRITLGRENTQEDIDYIIKSIENILEKLYSKVAVLNL